MSGGTMRALMGILLVTCSTGCSVLVDKINQEWPPRSIDADQAEGIADARKGLDELGTAPTLYMGIQIRSLEAAFSRAVNAAVPQVKAVRLASAQQTIFLDFEFDGAFDLGNGETVDLSGLVRGYAIPASVGSMILLRPGVIQVEIKGATYRGTRVLPELVSLINATLNRFIGNINGTVRMQFIDLKTELVKQFDPKDLVIGNSGMHAVYGNPIKLHTALDAVAILVDTTGMRVLATMTTFDSGGMAAVERNIAAVDFDRMSRAQAAVMSRCPEFMKRPGIAPRSFSDVCARFLTHSQRIASRELSGRIQRTPEELRADYERYRDEFWTRGGAMGVDANAFADRTAVAVTKKFIATGLNTVGKQMEFGFSMNVPNGNLPLDETLKTGPKTDLNCRGNLPDCYDGQDCRPTHTCRGRGDCPGSCWDFDPFCRTWKAACEVMRDTERTVCEADKARQFAMCEVGKGARNAACEVTRAAAAAACQVNQDWLDLFAEKEIGRVEGKVAMTDGTVTLTVGAPETPGLAISDDLTSIRIPSRVAAAANVGADLRYTPLNLLGHALCIARWDGHIDSKVKVDWRQSGLSGTLTPHTDNDGTLRLDMGFQPMDFKLEFDPPPLEALFKQNPHVAVACSGATLLGATAQLFADVAAVVQGKDQKSLIPKSFDFQLSGIGGVLRLPPIPIILRDFTSIQNESNTVTLKPEWREHAIVYIER